MQALRTRPPSARRTSRTFVRFAVLDNVLWITSAGPQREQPSKLWPSKQPLFVHMLTQVHEAARRCAFSA